MNKIIIIFFLMMYIYLPNSSKLYARTKDFNPECKMLFNIYDIDTLTKSHRGWIRVCNNNKLHLYMSKRFDIVEDRKSICECFKKRYNHTDID